MNATPTLEWLDPATLTVDTNVRKDAALTPAFIASIKEHGVLEPVIAHRKDDGAVHVLMGQRRTLAAVEANRPLVPVMVTDSPEEAERIVTQVVENIQRAELTQADEADAYHQLSLIGVSAAAIAKKTGRTRTTVESALKAKSTDSGSAALGKGYTIEAALILAEFESDEDAVEELESVIRAEPDMLAHVTQQLRDRRDRAAALAALRAELEAAGTTVVETAGYDEDSENVRVTSLNRADGEPATEEDANAVAITTAYNGTHSTAPVVAGWKDLGFTLRYSYGSSSANKGPMTEEQKAERKTLIQNNKLMQSGTTVRREYVKTLLARKQAPKGWQYFTLHAITHHSETASGYEGKVAADMIGAKFEESNAWAWNPLREHVAKTTARPEFSLIALVCAGYEKTIAKDSWRSPSQTHRDYLNQLITWGYTASVVEQLILDSAKPVEDEAAA
ncbi:ParB/RepB/Spo0J family partition protein (plasmid) [Pseudarthrobacter psychrotolerans]|uniref:ParB/RepB/Spo0J family partition protein n=1 Tax=Pseudarthrobacter psychrotolerans TaxID=2697569 RepID=A0A6P1NTY1_9MICC|nr:ParB/RepB/Spo0J family partition protein [Pseudarthrobacter psychrotolerans]QHK22508.1 ParB/RepB/Spo0J family partition protein [Pseudarthrobacter psychrotolerans]